MQVAKTKPTSRREVRVRVAQNATLARFLLGPVGRILMASVALFVILGIGVFTFFYVKYSRLIDEKLKAGPFAATAKIYAAPEAVAVGDVRSPESIAEALRRSGYNESHTNPNRVGSFELRGNSIEIYPGPDSYFDQEPGVIKFSGNRIAQIISLADNTLRPEYELEPELITNLSGPSREKRRFVKFGDIPKILVEAVTSAEDKRFFQHNGLDPVRIVKAAYVDLKQGRKEQGASTLSQQLARMFWLDQDKSWTRKLAEVVITLQIEQKLSKEEIFEDYANQVPLGMRGTFAIHGFGEAAEAYLGKDLGAITLPEAAELAGMIQRPSYFNPFRHAEHVVERRNLVLNLMNQNGFISDRDCAAAKDTALTVAKGAAQSKEAPYFVDLVGDAVQTRFQDQNFEANAYRIYTTLDPRLQAAAEEAIRAGMESVDAQIKRQRRFRGQVPPEPQVALVAIDPHTGEIRALVGGRNYGTSQLNHAVRDRQPGSIFKPFVYAAALDTAVEGGKLITASTILHDEPTEFWFDGKVYAPKNFDEYRGDVTLRDALAHSLNNATVSLAEMVGYQNVVDMARRAGLNDRIQATPAVALGAYEITPIEAAGAYTIFANGGIYVKPSMLTLVRDQKGQALYKNQAERKQVLDPRVAYLTTNLMQEVLRSGTGAAIPGEFSFFVPAAGKTGTSSNLRDGWFAGFTSELLCVVWVGFDDTHDLGLQGAASAAPIWGDFMKRALAYREYRDTKDFPVPPGIVSIDIDAQTGMPATNQCPKTHPEVYIAGTEPVGLCPLHGGRAGVTTVAGWDTTPSADREKNPAEASPRETNSARPADSAAPSAPGADSSSPRSRAARAARQNPDNTPAASAPDKKQDQTSKKKSLLQRIIGVFK